MELTCPHCGYKWTPKVAQPKRCPGRNVATGKICGKWL
jgi:predicted Zn-ribbon and HTH transcriptional regulator